MATFSAMQFKSLAPGKRLFVGDGLFLFVTPAGIKSWRCQPRLGGRRITVVLGRWPDLTLDDARALLRDAKQQIKAGRHPIIDRKIALAKTRTAQASTFGALFAEWFAKFSPSRSSSWRTNAERWYSRFLAPVVGDLPVEAVTAPMIMEAMERAEATTSLHAAHAVRQLATVILDRGVVTGSITQNPARSLKGAMDPHAGGQMAAMSHKDAKKLAQKIGEYEGLPQMRCALALMLHTALRVSEIAEIERTWVQDDTLTIPRAMMKVKAEKRGDHLVPLSLQAQVVVREAMKLATSKKYLFGGLGTRSKPLSRSAFNRAIERMDVGDISPHSIRNAFSTWAHENEIATPGVIEAVLDHACGSETARAYSRGTLLNQRRELMQKWSDTLESKVKK